MTTRLTWLLATFLLIDSLGTAQSRGCMGIPSYSTWAQDKSFPFHPSSARTKLIKRGFKRLKLGMATEQAISLMPQPDWAEESWKGCTWYYEVKVASSDGLSRKGVNVRFGHERTVNGLGSYR